MELCGVITQTCKFIMFAYCAYFITEIDGREVFNVKKARMSNKMRAQNT